MDSSELDSTSVPPNWSEHLVALRRLAAGLQHGEDARDDVVQETLLAALLRPPRVLSWGWLAASLRSRSVDRTRRGERRERHELRGELPRAAPSAEEIALRLELQSELNAAVRSLREPYQRVVYLRFVEERTPTEIAAALGVPVKTVKTQLARGLALLRERLERRYGRELSGLAFLFPSAAATGALVGFAGLLLMLKKVAVAVAVVVGLLGLWYAFTPAQTAGSEPADVANAHADVRERAEPGLPVAAPSDEVRRAAAEAQQAPMSDAPPPRALRVRVLWSDGTPASGIGVRVLGAATHRPIDGAGVVESDRDGVALFACVPSEPLLARADRGVEIGPVSTADATDDVLEVELRIEPGVAVHGRVVDPRGAGVAGAEIGLLSGRDDWLSLDRLARSDTNGRFELRDVPRRLSLCATAPGFAPSEPSDLELASGAPPFELELKLAAEGGDLVGRVVQASGAPVPFAWVALARVEHPTVRFDGTFEEVMGPRATACDAEGRFRIDGVEPGTWPLQACAPAFALSTTTVTIHAGRAHEVVVELERGAELTGVVRDEAAAPVAGAHVRAFARAVPPTFIGMGQFEDLNAFGSPQTRTDAEGRYRLGPVWTSEVHAYAYPSPDEARALDRPVVHAKAVLHPNVGAVLVWDPVLAPGHTIRGRVTFSDGSPMSDVFVNATPSDAANARAAYTDGAGEFGFLNLDFEAFRVDVQLLGSSAGLMPLVREEVWPDRGRLELRAAFENPERGPRGTVRGKVVDADGRAPEGTGVGAAAKRDVTYFPSEYEQGAFRFDDLAAGEYRVLVFRGEDALLVGDAFELAPGETLDVGTLLLPPKAALRVRIDRSNVGTDSVPWLYLTRSGTMLGRVLELGTSDELSIDGLTVGSYALSWWGTGLAQGERLVDLAHESEVVIAFEPGWPHTFDIAFPPTGAGRELELVITAADGATVFHTRLLRQWNESSPHRFGPTLPAGSFRITATTDSGLSAAQDFVVRADESGAAETSLVLK